MIRFRITIRWRAYRWSLQGIARSSVDLLVGLLDHVPEGALVSVRRA